MANLTQLCIDGICSDVMVYQSGDDIIVINGNQISADLSNYYDKDDVDSIVDAINTGAFEVVNELPETGEDKTIYLVPNGGTAPNVKDEYIYVNGAWEKIGTTEVDLSNYYTKTQTDDLLDAKQDVLTAGDGIDITGNTISADIPNATTSAPGLMSAADKTKLDGIEAGAEANQNAFSNVQVGDSVIEADTEEDTLTLIAGDNVTLTPNATGDAITIAATVPDISGLATAAALQALADRVEDLEDLLDGLSKITFSKTDSAGTISGTFLGEVNSNNG